MNSDDPIKQITALSGRSASGELIYASSSCEIHVYMQNGMIAWATDSRHPFAFAKHLQETGKIEKEVFRKAIDECRRERLQLGETLVNRGLLSWDDVRTSLRHQIQQAIDLLKVMPDGQSMFLERAYAKYNEKLTFDVLEFLVKNTADTPTEPGDKAPDIAIPSNLPEHSKLANEFTQAVGGLLWVEILDPNALKTDAPKTVYAPLEVVQSTILDGADFSTIRSNQGCLIGVQLEVSGQSLWCQLRSDSTLGMAISALRNVANARATAPRARGLPLACNDNSDSEITREFETFLRGAPEIYAGILLGESGKCLVGFASPDLEDDLCIDLARRRIRCLEYTCALETTNQYPEDELGAMGLHTTTMMTGEGDLWCFGAVLRQTPMQTLWLLMDRSTSQGLGWAYLATLTRSLFRLPIETK